MECEFHFFSWCGLLPMPLLGLPEEYFKALSDQAQAVGFSPLTPVSLLHKFHPPTSKSAMLFVLLSSQTCLLLLVVELLIYQKKNITHVHVLECMCDGVFSCLFVFLCMCVYVCVSVWFCECAFLCLCVRV